VKELFSKYTLVQLYTDKVPAYYQPTTSAEENRKLLNDRFGTAQLPTYVILKPLGKGEYQEISRYEEGKINNVEAFLEFLRRPLESSASRSVAQASGTP
jgi:hypothetical protein